MADTKVEDEVPIAAVAGGEILYCVLAGSPRNVTADRIAAYAANPPTNDGRALGSSILQWSDVFLASGGVINFGGGNATIVHSPGIITINAAGVVNGVLTAQQPVGANVNVLNALTAGMANGQRVYSVLGDSLVNNKSFVIGYNHDATSSLRYFSLNAFEATFGAQFKLRADGVVALGAGVASTNSTTGTEVITGGLGVSADINWGGGALTTWTPTFTTKTGGPPTVSVLSASFKKFGKLVVWRGRFQITATGGGAGNLIMTTPSTATSIACGGGLLVNEGSQAAAVGSAVLDANSAISFRMTDGTTPNVVTTYSGHGWYFED